MEKGKLIVLEGIDGSGKSAQYRRLCERMERDKIAYNHIVFPRYDKDSSALIRMYLGGQFGSRPDDVNAYTASTFYAIDRFASYREDWGRIYENGGIILSDRYTTSNAVHQCCKLPGAQWDAYLDWLFDYEYRLLGLPTPDLVVYLRLGIETSQRLMSERYHGDEKKKDIHESNLSYLEQAHLAADYCASKYNWKTVECAERGSLRCIDEIGADVWNMAARTIEL